MESPVLYRGHVGRDVIDDQLPSYYLLRPGIVHGISLSLLQLKRILQGMNLRRRMYTSHSTIIQLMIVCAERMLSRLDPLGTLQRKRLFFLPCYCVLQTCYSDVLFKLISVYTQAQL